MRTFKIFNALLFALLLATSVSPAHAGIKLWQTQKTHRTQVGMNFYVQAHVSRLPYVVGGDLFYQPVPGTGSTSATLWGDVDFTIHYERNGASGEFAQHLDKQGIQILMNSPYDGDDWRVIAEIDPRQERRLPKNQRWSGLLKVRFHADELPYGLLRFRTNLDPDYKQSPTWIYLYRVKQTYWELQQIAAGAQTGTPPAHIEEQYRNEHGRNKPPSGGRVQPPARRPHHPRPHADPPGRYEDPREEDESCEDCERERLELPGDGSGGFDPETYEDNEASQSHRDQKYTPPKRRPQSKPQLVKKPKSRSKYIPPVKVVVSNSRRDTDRGKYQVRVELPVPYERYRERDVRYTSSRSANRSRSSGQSRSSGYRRADCD